jgi:hypothetical protein
MGEQSIAGEGNPRGDGTVHDFSGRKTPMVFAPHLMAY